jgi:hypothetical protein
MSYAYFHAANHNLIGLFRRLGAGVLRIGGGSVDRVLWTPENTGATHMQVSPANIKALASFLKAAGWQCLYGINLATSTPSLAAAEVACAVSLLGPQLLGIEIGNESDEYGVAGNLFAGNWSFGDFFARWQLFYEAIRLVAPHVPITGPATGGANHISTWTLPFAMAVRKGDVTLLTQHYYRGDGASSASTALSLVGPDPQLLPDLETLSTGASAAGLPYRIAECNSFNHGGVPGVSNSYASALWVVDFLFSVALGGATGVNLHGGGQAPGYTPIADHSGAVIEARPEYYGMLLFTLAGEGQLLETELLAGPVEATAYAIRSASNVLNIVVVNKDPVQNLTLTIEAGQTIASATLQSMTAPGLTSLSGIRIQGASVGTDGSFAPASPDTLTPAGTQTTCFVPALSAALIRIS